MFKVPDSVIAPVVVVLGVKPVVPALKEVTPVVAADQTGSPPDIVKT